MPSQPAASSDADANVSGVEDLLPAIETALEAASKFGSGCPPRLADAMRYALLAPGKRLRPSLVLMAAEACGGSHHDAMPAAVAVEMVHAYSLIHDDLPAMDDDDLRRGRPTVHVKFDEATAILAGDALLAQAFAHLADHLSNPPVAAAAMGVLAHAAGPTQLVGGQCDDLAGDTGQAPDVASQLSHLESIHRRKTGALFGACLELGAMVAGGSQQQRHLLGNYAESVGLAFQVIDDVLDWTADDQTLGKRTGKDLDHGKLTYPGLLGLEESQRKAGQLVHGACEAIAVFGSRAWRLTWLAKYVLERRH